MTSRLRLFLSLALLFLLFPEKGLAQNGYTATLSQLNDNKFPVLQFFLDIQDEQGDFSHNLSTDQVKVIEDGVTLPAIDMTEIKPGLQFVVAINPGPSFAIRNSKAISRYDMISQNLANWAKNRVGSDIDDLSLIISNGPEISHINDSQQWLQTLETAQIDSRNATPNLDSLFRAVTLANDATPRTGMKRAVLFITPPVESQQIEPLDNLIAQVQQQNISIHIWLVSTAGGFQTVGVKRLTELATLTGGTFFAFSGEETIPDPETFLQELRSIYSVTYKSAVSTGGIHQVSAQIETETGVIETNSQEIEIDLQPPLPAFISPPIRIIRQPIQTEQVEAEKSNSIPGLLPTEQVFQVVFDFPDGRKREIISSSLLVNGEMVEEKNQAPFDTFTWNISDIVSGSTYSVQVQVVDEFGITGKSVEIPIIIGIEQETQDPWGVVRQNTPVLIILAVVVSGAILLLVLILGGRLRPRAVRVSQTRRKRQDPVTQPVSIEDDLARRNIPGWVNKLQWSQRQSSQKAFAYLYPLSKNAQMVDSSPFPINAEEVLIGNNPEQASLVLKDSSVEKLHARLVRKVEGSFRLIDEGSIAGTWINYTPVSRNGADLEHGDIVHIGRVGFRFTIRQPKLVRRPVVTPLPAQSTSVLTTDLKAASPQTRMDHQQSREKPDNHDSI
jgi:hypothetical protein